MEGPKKHGPIASSQESMPKAEMPPKGQPKKQGPVCSSAMDTGDSPITKAREAYRRGSDSHDPRLD